MIAIRFGLYLSLMLLVGLAAFPLYALRPDERADGRVLHLRRTFVSWTVAALVLSVLGFAALIAAMMGGSILDIDWEMCRSMLFETSIGTAWLVRIAALLAVLVAAFSLNLPAGTRLVAIAVAGTVALSSLVWTGHAGATEGSLGLIHKASDMLHMFAAAIWLGGIAAFLLLLREPSDHLWGGRLQIGHRALEDFSRVGTICVAIIVVTGLINGQVLMGISNIPLMFETRYGQLLILKLALVAGMLFLAARNRWRLTPNLGARLSGEGEGDAVAPLRRSLLLEAGAALAILGLVAWLGMLEPTASMGVD
jgi:putative copper resistance protein D